MARSDNIREIEPNLSGAGLRIGIVLPMVQVCWLSGYRMKTSSAMRHSNWPAMRAG